MLLFFTSFLWRVGLIGIVLCGAGYVAGKLNDGTAKKALELAQVLALCTYCDVLEVPLELTKEALDAAAKNYFTLL